MQNYQSTSLNFLLIGQAVDELVAEFLLLSQYLPDDEKWGVSGLANDLLFSFITLSSYLKSLSLMPDEYQQAIELKFTLPIVEELEILLERLRVYLPREICNDFQEKLFETRQSIQALVLDVDSPGLPNRLTD